MNTQLRHPAITTTGLRKSYGAKIVLGGIDLSVAEGTVFALLGPNGAGKTTTVQILSTLLDADGVERDFQIIDAWWRANRGESWRPVRKEEPRPPAQG
jgi:ABC-type multidrug transport system ATPase subunit